MGKQIKLKDVLTIVIPAKNEAGYIGGILTDIVRQYNIIGTRVIVADGGSTDDTINVVNYHKKVYEDQINIELIKGGSVSRGRNAGLELVNTRYVIFIDADVHLYDHCQLLDVVKKLKRKKLVGAKLRSRGSIKSRIAYTVFNFMNPIIAFWQPFAVGSFFATRTSVIRNLGGWDEELVHSEDWVLSSKYSLKDYVKCSYPIIVDDRRFKKMGYWGMAVMMWKSMIHGRKYQKKDNGYWN